MRQLESQEQAVVDLLISRPDLNEAGVFKKLGLRFKDGKRLIKRPAVRHELEGRKNQARYEAMISCKRVMEEEACIAFADPLELYDEQGKLVPPHLLPERIRRAITVEVKEIRDSHGVIKNVEYKYTLLDKKSSLEKISKHLGLYEKDNLQKAIQIYFMSPGDEGAPDAEVVPEIENNSIKPAINLNKAIALLE